jgi:hypothetical protein
VLTWITQAIRRDDVAIPVARSADRSRSARLVHAAADAAAGGDGRVAPPPELMSSEVAGDEVGRSTTSPLGGRWARVVGIAVTGFFVSLYVYNTIRFDRDTLSGDQWVWVREVLIPYDQGRRSMLEAITFEYGSLSHSHIPTLTVLLANSRLLHLDLSVDAFVGVLSLVGVAVVVHRHASRSSPLEPWLVTGAVAALVFMSSHFRNFTWSLLQFQMFYVLVAIWYLYRFGRQVENPRPIHALLVVPATLVLGDAIGVAAVLASMVYLVAMVLGRRIQWRKAALHLMAFPILVVILGRLLTGVRSHGEQSFGQFIDLTRGDPGGAVRAGIDALAGALVGFRDEPPTLLPFLSWDWSAWGVLATLVLAAAAVVGVRRGGLTSHDHFPLMLVLASGIWSAGVIRSRFWMSGPEAMREYRYVPYTTLLGVGLILVLAAKWAVLGGWRFPSGAVLLVAVLASATGSLDLTRDVTGEHAQRTSLATLDQFVEGSIDAPSVGGLQCTVERPCLEAAWYLWDEGLGPFAGRPSGAPSWVPELRAAVFAEIRSIPVKQRPWACALTMRAADLSPGVDALGVSVPPGSDAEAEKIYGRAFEVQCRAWKLIR